MVNKCKNYRYIKKISVPLSRKYELNLMTINKISTIEPVFFNNYCSIKTLNIND